MEISIKLPVFEGPLDLLLHLIRKNKINIYDIPIVEITDQYMAHLGTIQEMNLDQVSAFLVMAATLLRIKSQYLLPVQNKMNEEEEEKEDPREELVQQLLQYQQYKKMAYFLKEQQEEAKQLFYKPETMPKEVLQYQPVISPEKYLENITLEQLHQFFLEVQRRERNKIDPIRSQYGNIETEKIRLSDKIEWIAQYIKQVSYFSLQQVWGEQRDKVERIVTFLGVLELMKNGVVITKQEALFDEIFVFLAQKKDEKE